MKKLILPLFSIFAAWALLSAAGCSRDKQAAGAPPEVVRDLPVVQIQRAALPDYVEAVGTVRAAQTAQLSAEIVATVREMRAREGQRVRLGDVLVVLDDAQQRAALDRAQAAIRAAQQDVAAAEADYGLAQSTLNRYQGLYDKKSVSPHEFDEVQAHAKAAAARRDAAQAGLGQARAAEAQAQAMLSYTRIRAPFDGVVTAKNVDPGTLASPGVPLLTVEDTRRFRLDATVDESDLRFVKPGAATAVVVEAAGGELAGKVAQIVPAADPASRTFVVKIELPGNAQLRSGLFGRAHFSRGARDSIVVPGTAVLDRGQMKSVYVVGADGMIDMRFITLGQRTGDKVEVLSGLTGGERLIAAPGGQDLAGRKLAN